MSAAGRSLSDFPGGLHLPSNKLDAPIVAAPLPARLIIPLAQHIGQPAKAIVNVGDTVLGGQVIAAAEGYVSTPIHASSSGTVVAIEDRPVAHPSGLAAACIVIETDGRDAHVEPPDTAVDGFALDPTDLRNRVRGAGVVGLGGAAFPSFIKLNPGTNRIDTLIINGAECEPYISCDQALMTAEAETILRGAQLIQHAVGARTCIVGVEDSKPTAIDALRAAADALDDDAIEIAVVPTRYPQGGEKQLIQTLTGREIPSEGLPLDIGIVCHNPATARAVWRAVTEGRPLIDRVVTVTGPGVATPGNFRVRLGTPVADLLEAAGGLTEPGPSIGGTRLIMGGPMMGFALRGADVPVVKATNCILALRGEDMRPDTPPMPCIRCGACADACPASLLPQQLYWHSKAREFDKAQHYSLFDCIECGCCAQVCPSHIPLVQYYRFAKTEIWNDERETRKADIARQRHEARTERLEREEAEKKAAREAKKAALRAKQAKAESAADQAADAPAADAGDDPVAAAIARAKAKKAARDANSTSS